ncbi:MAG: DciA family protein [Hyphomicrobiaceae bacterium]
MHLKAPTRSSSSARAASEGTGAARPATRAVPRSALAAYAARLPVRQPPSQSAAPRPIPAKTVGSFVPRLTRPAFERYGFSAAALITDWETIVGGDIAAYTMPERLKWPRRVEWTGEEVSDEERGRPGATLILAVAAGRALDIQYKAAQLVERINSYFGYRAVADLRIVQVPQIKPPAALSLPPIQPTAPPRTPRAELAEITEPGLRAALERMAEGLGARMARRRQSA